VALMGGPPIVAARRAAERLMVDSCIIRHKTGDSTDPTTGVVTATYADAYSGKCKVQAEGNISRLRSAADHEFTIQRSRVDIPAGSPSVAVGDMIDITSSANDPALVGRRFRVIEMLHKSFASSQRFGVEEVTGG
jgi:hypothetical protein